MKTLKVICSFFAFSIVFFTCAQNNNVEIKTHKLTDNIYMLVGQGGNIGISVGDDGIVMIDSQFAPLTPKILDAIKSISDKPIKFLINTHWHHDHVGGNENIKNQGAVIVAHDNVRKRKSVDQFDKYRDVKRSASPTKLPLVSFSENMTFHMNGEDIMVFHVDNAHTDGDAMIYFTKSNVLHMGDTYFQGKYPFIDISTGGSVNGYIDAVKQALLLVDDDTKVIPGHLNLSNKKELSDYLTLLKTIKTRVLEEIKKGKTQKEVTENTAITKEYTALNYGDWFINDEQIRRTFYISLTQK
ncbi:MBL fold metallo-hydrolase [Gelatiniphilus marinus]|uniref:MBL fold metallo-hydrolase n=1 Tax=Gelatiniphilus marinus TaxID=1759464 RepID=A0ABW5JYE2_9FLAO